MGCGIKNALITNGELGSPITRKLAAQGRSEPQSGGKITSKSQIYDYQHLNAVAFAMLSNNDAVVYVHATFFYGLADSIM